MKVETSHRDLPLVGRQVVAEQKMFWRNPAAAGFTIIFPLFFLIIFSLLNGTATSRCLRASWCASPRTTSPASSCSPR